MAASASVERFLTRLLIRVVRRRRLLWLVCCAAVAGAVALAVFAGALLVTDLFNTMALTYSSGTPLAASLWLTARELAVSLPFAMLVHLAFSRVHRRFSGR